MPRAHATLTLPNSPDPGEAFVGPLEVTLVGLGLTNPQATWPTSYNDPSITWRDDDGDGQPGITSFIPTTGRSSTCNLPYAALPIPSSGALATRIYGGNRSIANLSGTIVDCDTIRGNLLGPKANLPQFDGHVIGCAKSDGSICTPAEITSLDSGGTGAEHISAARFSLVRVADTTTCAQVRALTFP
jgi:hypothetical protein